MCALIAPSQFGGRYGVSYLSEQKTRLCELVDGLQEELGKIESAEQIPELLKAWKVDCWRLFEEGMKQSFANGKLSVRTVGNNGGAEEKRKPFAWKRKEGS
jgi:hypothetical protein